MDEQKKTTAINEDEMELFLNAFKQELISIFKDRTGQLEYETGWTYMADTAGWAKALENASKNTVPLIYELWNLLSWRDGEKFSDWIIDCAVDHGTIKPMSEDPDI